MNPMMIVAQAVQWLPGAVLRGDGSAAVNRVHTDTRSIEPGDLFVALKGERYDANDFLQEAQQRGAIAAICHSGADRSGLTSMACIVVPDTRLALGALARAWRAQFSLPMIAVTGSNGKTTVTQMLASILATFKPDGGSLATRGNLNNEIGVPMTLLRLRKAHQIAVIELGMNHPGEIAALAAMVQPTVALVNNANTLNSCTPCARSRWKTAPSSRPWAHRAWWCFPGMMNTPPCGSCWPVHGARSPLRWTTRRGRMPWRVRMRNGSRAPGRFTHAAWGRICITVWPLPGATTSKIPWPPPRRHGRQVYQHRP
jgi:hypothetical protein